MADRFPSVWADGAVQPAADYSIPPTERAFRYGDGLFATLRLEDGLLLDAEAHIERLVDGAGMLGLTVPRPIRTAGGLADVLRALEVEAWMSAVIRVQVSAGTSSRGYRRTAAAMSWELVEVLPLPPSRRLRAAVLADGEVPAPALPGVKSCSALTHVLCARAADRRRVDEVVRVQAGWVTEAAAANVFWVRDDALVTPAADLPLYPGVTRSIVLRVAGEAGVHAEEGRFGPEELAAASGVFLTNSVRGVEPVGQLDGRELPWPGLLDELGSVVRKARRSAGVRVT
jgi:4-amino-4-deoxychorismate lyase